jgi:hypothetical protein
VYAGYGRPTLYFLLHGALIVIETQLARAGRPIDRLPWVYSELLALKVWR